MIRGTYSSLRESGLTSIGAVLFTLVVAFATIIMGPVHLMHDPGDITNDIKG